MFTHILSVEVCPATDATPSVPQPSISSSAKPGLPDLSVESSAGPNPSPQPHQAQQLPHAYQIIPRQPLANPTLKGLT